VCTEKAYSGGVHASYKGEGWVSSGVSAVYIGLPSGLLGHACSGVTRKRPTAWVKTNSGMPRDWFE
jgi:hypothetical protein